MTPILSVAHSSPAAFGRVGVQSIVQCKSWNRCCLRGIQEDESQPPAFPNYIWRKPVPSKFSRKFRKQHIPLVSRRGEEDSFFANVNEEDDGEMYDKLFDKYGKVVYSSGDKKSAGDEIDDDAESLSFAVAMAKVASEVKAADIKVLFVKPLVYWTRFFIIATAFSRPQIDAIGSRIRDLAETQYGKVPSGDMKPNSWTLLDFGNFLALVNKDIKSLVTVLLIWFGWHIVLSGDVVIHIFLPQHRAFYNLEEFYGNATHIELPFENQQPPFRP
ncbi:hypothetical protein SAY87_021780 [Trapa incisa]|uniref:Protein Iojap, chloroplastic n=1 Tax=Trapa incisa TaxID=236973 RepID=A0AAN7JTZ6_9MYRT|nr:hypothetical protein SAY87_021780 [Trapa incisa]